MFTNKNAADGEPKLHHRRRKEASFTLLETIIAVGLLVTVILEVSNVQGNAITFTQYDRKVTQGVWLAKAIMGKIEWGHQHYELKDLAAAVKAKDQEFEESLCPRDPSFDCDFKYNAEIEEWSLPFVDLLTNGMNGGTSSEDDDSDSKESSGSSQENPFADMIKQYVSSIFGDDLLKIAHVEVYWPEGSKTNSVNLTLLLPNQRALNRFILDQKGFKRQKEAKAPAGKTEQPGTAQGDTRAPPPGAVKDGPPGVAPQMPDGQPGIPEE